MRFQPFFFYIREISPVDSTKHIREKPVSVISALAQQYLSLEERNLMPLITTEHLVTNPPGRMTWEIWRGRVGEFAP